MKVLEFNIMRMVLLMEADYSFCEAFEKHGFSADVAQLRTLVEQDILNEKAKQALRKVYQEHIVEGTDYDIAQYNAIEVPEKIEKVFPENFNERDCREFLKRKGFFVENLWTTDDVIGHAKDLGYETSEEQAKEIFELLGRRHDATIGVNWDSIGSVIEEYYN